MLPRERLTFRKVPLPWKKLFFCFFGWANYFFFFFRHEILEPREIVFFWFFWLSQPLPREILSFCFFDWANHFFFRQNSWAKRNTFPTSERRTLRLTPSRPFFFLVAIKIPSQEKYFSNLLATNFEPTIFIFGRHKNPKPRKILFQRSFFLPNIFNFLPPEPKVFLTTKVQKQLGLLMLVGRCWNNKFFCNFYLFVFFVLVSFFANSKRKQLSKTKLGWLKKKQNIKKVSCHC